jgi:hypothetical protein
VEIFFKFLYNSKKMFVKGGVEEMKGFVATRKNVVEYLTFVRVTMFGFVANGIRMPFFNNLTMTTKQFKISSNT